MGSSKLPNGQRMPADKVGGSRFDPIVEPRQWSAWTLGIGGAGLAIGLLLVMFSVPCPYRLSAMATCGLAAGAALLLGGLAGFLFAFPRFGAEGVKSSYLPNTNLEQVSDWLTKIIVGIGLVQAGSIADGFVEIVGTASTEIDGTTSHRVAIGATAIAALVLGFVAGYVQARVALPRWFKSADPEELHELDQRIRRLEEGTQDS